MALETANVVNDLVITNPTSTDPKSQGDDHLRLIKSVLRNTFPGASGNGFSKQIIATEDEINALTGGEICTYQNA